MFQYNVQHDCRTAHCVASGKRTVVQERVQTELTESAIEHKPVDIFLINTHTFHNAHLIRAILPRNLTQPIPYAANREAHHAEIAALLRNSQNEKRQKTAGKKKATGTDCRPQASNRTWSARKPCSFWEHYQWCEAETSGC